MNCENGTLMALMLSCCDCTSGIRAVMRTQRHVPANKPDDFFISTSEQLVQQFHNVTSMVALLFRGMMQEKLSGCSARRQIFMSKKPLKKH